MVEYNNCGKSIWLNIKINIKIDWLYRIKYVNCWGNNSSTNSYTSDNSSQDIT